MIKNGFLWFDHPAPSGRDGARLGINLSTEKVKIVTWLESCHNGDHYDTVVEEHDIDSDDARIMLECTELMLLNDAKRYARRLIESKKDEEMELKVRDMINNVPWNDID